MTLFDDAKSAYVAKKKREEEARCERRIKWRKFNIEWHHYALEHPPFPMDGAQIIMDSEESPVIRFEGRDFGISTWLPSYFDSILPDEALAKDMSIRIAWSIRGICPDCLKEVWSEEFSDLAGLGEQLVKFKPYYSHRAMECSSDKFKLEQQLHEFEWKYCLRSAEFYEKFERGEMGDAMDFVEWAATYEMVMEAE